MGRPEKRPENRSEGLENAILRVNNAYFSLGYACGGLSGPLLTRLKKAKNITARVRGELVKQLEENQL